jgi:hypothetical protein
MMIMIFYLTVIMMIKNFLCSGRWKYFSTLFFLVYMAFFQYITYCSISSQSTYKDFKHFIFTFAK